MKATQQEREAWHARRRQYLRLRDKFGCKVNKKRFIQVNSARVGALTSY